MSASTESITLSFDATQEARHAALLRANEMARAMVERVRIVITLAVAEDDRSLRQNRFYWGVVLQQISAQAPGGWTADAWHELFKRQVLGYEVVKVKVAGRKKPTIYRRLRSTTQLTVKQMSDYLDQVIALATTDAGVEFDFDQQEREAVRYVRPTRKRQGQPA